MQLNEIKALVSQDLAAVDDFIATHLGGSRELVQRLSTHIIGSGGKRLRPLLTLLSAHCCNYQGSHHIDLAAAVELIHTATLLHDDVVDNSSLRRGQNTANDLWGNSASILVGDYLYSRTFQMMVATEQLPILKLLADCTNTIAEGEVLQLSNRNNPMITEQHYTQIIERKTATLFAAAAEIGPTLTNHSHCSAFATYGLHLGIAFQLIDDALDYQADPKQTGKNIGDDLADGYMTMPLIYALNHCDKDDAEIIRNSIKSGNIANLEKIQQVITQTSAIEYTKQLAQTQAEVAKQALSEITESEYQRALLHLADLAVSRSG